MMEVRGEIVHAMDGVFAVDWYTESDEIIETLAELEKGLPPTPVAAGGDPTAGDPVSAFQLVPSGPGYRTQPGLRMFTQLVSQARERLRIVSPYFIPDEALLHALTSAAYRGVAVEVFVPERADQFGVHHAQRSYF